MTYTPVHAVWEITYACNMRCEHCGSGCGEKYPDELTTSEALQLCDDLAELGLKGLTLSGGEPFLRKDWPRIARRLKERGIVTNVISNGWYLSRELLTEAREAGITNIGLSLDGLEENHDDIRTKGSYRRVLSALALMAEMKIPSCVNTTVNRRNLPEIPRLKEILITHKVRKWQFQLATPMGNLLEHQELVLQPEEIDDLIDATYAVMQEGRIEVYLAITLKDLGQTKRAREVLQQMRSYSPRLKEASEALYTALRQSKKYNGSNSRCPQFVVVSCRCLR